MHITPEASVQLDTAITTALAEPTATVKKETPATVDAPEKANGESQEEHDTEAAAEAVADEPTFDVGGEAVPLSVLQTWKQDHENAKDWRKKNTEEAMRLADARKQADPMTKLIERLRGNEELSADYRASLVEEYGEEAGTEFDAVLAFDATKWKHPAEIERDALKQKEADREQMEQAVEKAEQSLDTFATDKKLTKTQKNALKDRAVEIYEKTGKALDWPEVWDKMELERLRKGTGKPPIPPKIPPAGPGPASITTKQKAGTRIKDLNIDAAIDAELAKVH